MAHERLRTATPPYSYPSFLRDVSAQAHWACLAGSGSGTCYTQADSPWPAPFPPPPPWPQARPCSAASQVLWSCPTSCARASSACVLRLPDAVWGFLFPRQTQDLPVPATCMHRVLDRAESKSVSRYRRPQFCLPTISTASALRSDHRLCDGVSISRLNTWPIRTPVNASSAPLRTPTHDSEPVWVANPSPYETFIHITLPVFTGAPKSETNSTFETQNSKSKTNLFGSSWFSHLI
jgi:hypothetical protein